MILLLACAKPVEPALAPPADRPLLLWKVEGERPSWLLGTCHLGIPLDHALPEPYRSAVLEARVLLNEVDLSGLGGPQTLQLLGRGEPLSRQLGPQAFGHVAQAVGPSLPAPLLDAMPPWMVTGLLLYAPTLQAAPVQPMDQALQQRLAARNVRVRALETLEEQLRLMEATNDANLAALRDLPTLAEGRQAESNTVLQACAATDPVLVEQSLVATADEPAMAQLLDARNRAWIPALAEELRQGGAVVAVGAAHFVGENGVLALLEAEGIHAVPQRGPPATWTLPATVAAAPLAPYVELAPAEREAWEAATREAALQALCGPEGQLAAVATDAACRAGVPAWTSLCVVQAAPTLQGAAPTDAAVRRLTTCASMGAMATMARNVAP